MKTEYKYIYFVKADEIKVAVWHCWSKDGFLGTVKWHRCEYCFFSEPDIIFNITSLNDVAHFIYQLSEVQRKHDKVLAEENDRKTALQPDI